MKKLIFLILITLNYIFAQPENPGPLKAGWTSATLNRDGRTINTIIYYPAFVEGSNSQIDTLNGPYPIVAFGHGFAMQNSYYISLFKHLASYGYIVIAPQFPDVNHLQLAFDLLFCVKHIKEQNKNSSSRFFNLVDTTKAGLSGHSMGGGASLLASANDSTINVVAPLAAAETNPSAISMMNKIKGVVYLITAQNDGITPPANHQIPMYNNALPIKAIPTLKGANHTKFMDTRIWDWTDPRGYLSAAEQLRLTRRYLTSIFNLFLNQDTSYFKFAFGSIAKNDTSIIFEYQLKPLVPLPFKLVSPDDTTIVLSQNVTFIWNSTYSLNLYDTVRYKILVGRDSSFNSISFLRDGLMDTILTNQFFEEGSFYWKVIAYTSDSTYIESDVKRFFLVLTKNNEEEKHRFNFKLEQNYPNPFNPITNISFSIPDTELVNLKVYDLLGREITTLINENLNAGFYSLKFDFSGLNSGVYLYKLQTSKFSDMKKMVLIK